MGEHPRHRGHEELVNPLRDRPTLWKVQRKQREERFHRLLHVVTETQMQIETSMSQTLKKNTHKKTSSVPADGTHKKSEEKKAFKQNARPNPQFCAHHTVQLCFRFRLWGEGVKSLPSDSHSLSNFPPYTVHPSPSFLPHRAQPRGRRMRSMTSKLSQPLHVNLNNQSAMAPSRSIYQCNQVPFYRSPVSESLVQYVWS